MKKLFILLFTIILFTPLFFFGKLHYQNISLQELPKQPLSESLSQFEKTFVKNIVFKERLIQTYNLLNLELFGYARQSNVLRGKDGWLFFATGLTDHRQRLPYFESYLKTVTSTELAHQQILTANDIVLLTLVAPDKQSVYSEYLPANPTLQINPRLSQKTLALAEKPELNTVNLLPKLRKAAQKQQIYYKYDTHWNRMGSFIAYQEVMKALKKDFPEIEVLRLHDFDITETNREERGDLSRILLSQTVLEDTDYIFTLNESGKEKLNQNKKLEKLILYEDSFFSEEHIWGTTHFLQLHFDEVITHTTNEEFNLDTIIEQKPTVVIREVVERQI